MIVILDTSIIVSDFYMKSANFKIFFDFAGKIPFEVFIPEIVYDEIINKYREHFEEQLICYEKSISKIKPLLVSRNVDFLSFDIDMQIDSYTDFLNDMRNKKKYMFLPYPKTTHRNIVKHELSRKKPFKSNGSGYRDKLIIDSILERFHTPEEEIVFISNNSCDFGQEPNLHEDLFFNRKINNRSRFVIKNTLSSFISEYVNPIMSINESIRTIPQLNQIARLDISSWILKNLKDIIYDNELGYDLLGLENGFGTIILHKIDIVNAISISDVLQLNDNTITCNVLIDARLIMYISGDQDDFIRSTSWADFLVYDPVGGYVDISTWQPINTKIKISIVIDSLNKQIISYEPIWVEGEAGHINYKW